MEGIIEKDDDRIEKEVWSLAVVVSFELHKVFVPCIGCVQGLRMMGLDEVVIVRCRK